MRTILWIALASATLAACASGPEYFDNHAAVDRNPACASRPDHPNMPVAADCEKTSGARWSNEGKPVDLSGAKSKPRDR
ncbi:hypothetical protein [Pseudoxanthomonas mexicana]|uniref:hypothetical protein n=1 Tax=Pseudoxanthomonas mexicana TaxID=128785 RepID=UPI0028A95C32|nr:hypothetical protein [Pseudoxanthomonas mexicana]